MKVKIDKLKVGDIFTLITDSFCEKLDIFDDEERVFVKGRKVFDIEIKNIRTVQIEIK